MYCKARTEWSLEYSYARRHKPATHSSYNPHPHHCHTMKAASLAKPSRVEPAAAAANFERNKKKGKKLTEKIRHNFKSV